MYVCLFVCMCTMCMQYLPEVRRGVGSPGTGGIAMGAGKCTWALGKSIKYS